MKTGVSSEGSLSAAYATDPGKSRAYQEDACVLDARGGVLLVSDGMGGHGKGGVASDIVAKVLPPLILKRIPAAAPPALITTLLAGTLKDLSERLRADAQGRPGLSGVGATVVLLFIRDGRAFVAHLGDSRACLYRGGRLEWLTRDHSVVQILEDDGAITREESRTHSARGKLSRYVGMDGEAQADVTSVDLRSGDRLLLCTDGLSGAVEAPAVARILHEQPDPAKACERLVEEANALSGKDNVTVVLADWRPSR